MTGTASDPEWDAIVRCWGSAYAFSVDRDEHPDQPYTARHREDRAPIRAASPSQLLDAIKDDAARRRPLATGEAT